MMRNIKGFIFIIASLLFAGNAHANSISFNLDLSNDMPDGVDYLTVTISDSLTTAGDIDFSVVVNTSSFPGPGSNFGMDNFYFNVDSGLTIDGSNITVDSPNSWNVNTNRNAGGGFGFFDFQIKGNGNSRTDLLTFTISGVMGDSVENYVFGLHDQDVLLAAAHVGGFDNGDGISSAKFGATVAAIPVPAALWLFGSGLLALAGMIRRRT